MPLNNQAPNSDEDINKFSNNLESILQKITNPSLSNLLKNYRGRKELLYQMIEDVDRPILKGLMADTVGVLANWFEDPETVCCLIQGLWAIYAKSVNRNISIGINETEWAKWIDLLVSFIDLIIVFLTDDIKKIVFFIPDVLKDIMNGVMGAILLVLQETLFALRDSILNTLLKAIDKGSETDKIWAKCLPLYQLIRILRKYISDWGLFADLFNKIKGFIAGKTAGFGILKKLDLPMNVKDLEFLYWFRNLLLNIKVAALNFDLCVNYAYSPSSAVGNIPTVETVALAKTPFGLSKASDLTKEDLGLTYTSDGSILIDREKVKDNTLPLLSNSSIRLFLNKYMGYPLDKVDDIITASMPNDSIQGTSINSDRTSNINADCPNTPDPETIVKWALNLRDRKK